MSAWLPALIAAGMVAISIAVSLLLWWHDRSLAADEELTLRVFRQMATLYVPSDVWLGQGIPVLERMSHAVSPLPWIVLVGGVISAFGTGALVRALQSARREIEARKRAEAELKLANAQLHAVFDHSPIHIVLKDLEGRYLMVNREWARFYGEDARAAIGKTPEEVHGVERAGPVRAQEAAVLLGSDQPPTEIQVMADGSERSVLIHKFAIRDESGTPIMLCGMGVDFTAQKRLERELRDSEGRLRTMLDALPTSVLLFDRNGRILYLNPTARRFAEIEPHEAVDATSRLSFVAPEHREAAATAFSQALAGQRSEVSFDLLGQKGGRRGLDIIYVPYARNEQGEVTIVLSLGRDVTERKRLEARVRQLQKLESVGTLAGGVAHEFNNLLGVVLGNLDLLSLQLKGDDTKQRLLERIVASATRGAELAHSMLSFGRRAMLAPVPTDLPDLIAHAIASMKDAIGEHITVDLVAAPDIARCTVDPIMFESAISQLVANAVDAMPEGGRLRIEMHDRWVGTHEDVLGIDGREGHYVVISIADDGHGMPAEVRARAAEPFFTTKKVGQASGLGLSMVHGFVHQSGGRLAIEPNPSGGTIVWMFLPAEGKIGWHDTTEKQAPTMSSYKVLVVEDEDELRFVTATGLKRHGYVVVEARNASEAIEALELHRDISLLFSDIMLGGGMDGFQLAKWVAARRPAIQLLLTSGYAGAELLPADLAARGVPFLNKPYRLEALVNQIAAMIGRPKVPLRVVS